MRAEVVAIGTELLLGQIVDTNSSYIGGQLAATGIDCHFQTRVGDNLERIALALRTALSRSDAVIACGGLGPTQDDITRDALAAVMNVGLRRDEAVLAVIRTMFSRRNRTMSESNARQADVPEGATIIPQTLGTAPGLICPVGHKVVYAVPGVPYELYDMLERAVLPDLRARAGEPSVIASRTLRTWGLTESRLAEVLGPHIEELDVRGAAESAGVPTIAFLASGIEGIKVRVTVKGTDASSTGPVLDAEEATIRSVVGRAVFGVDDETMEVAVGSLLLRSGRTLAVAESLTGGLVASRIVAVPGASEWFRGAVVAYSSEVKRDVLGIGEGPVVSAPAAAELAERARELLGADVGLATTGVAGPAEQEGQPAGTVFCGIALAGSSEAVELRLPGDRERVRQYATISALDVLRQRLLDELG